MRKRFDATTLKWFAIAAMIIDHVAWAYVPTESHLGMLMHTIGKITGPLMFYFIAEGYHYTKDIKKYALRLFAFAIISQLPYMMFLNGIGQSRFTLNVMFTLLCALICLIAKDNLKDPIYKIGTILVLVGITYWSDWSFYGVLITLCFGIFYGQPLMQWSSYAFINAAKIISTALMHPANRFYYLTPVILSPIIVFLLLNSYTGTKGGSKYSKWAFYVIYPLHLLILALLIK